MIMMFRLKYGNAHELIKDKNNSNEFALDFDSYIQKTHESYQVLESIIDELKDATIAGMKRNRFGMELQSRRWDFAYHLRTRLQSANAC